jgi:hypothetical protein
LLHLGYVLLLHGFWQNEQVLVLTIMTFTSLPYSICSRYSIVRKVLAIATDIHLPLTHWALPFPFLEVGVFCREMIKKSVQLNFAAHFLTKLKFNCFSCLKHFSIAVFKQVNKFLRVLLNRRERIIMDRYNCFCI